MRKTFKISTFVLKLAFFSMIAGSFMLASVNTHAKSENDKMINQQVRLTLWYAGLENAEIGPADSSDSQLPEELGRAMQRLEGEQRPDKK